MRFREGTQAGSLCLEFIRLTNYSAKQDSLYCASPYQGEAAAHSLARRERVRIQRASRAIRMACIGVRHPGAAERKRERSLVQRPSRWCEMRLAGTSTGGTDGETMLALLGEG